MTSPIKMFFPEPAMLGKDMEFQSSAINLTIKRLPVPGGKSGEGVTVVTEAGCDCKSKKIFLGVLARPVDSTGKQLRKK